MSETPANTAAKTSKSTGTFLWILGLFVAVNFSWGLIRPLEMVPHTFQPNLELSKAALRYKMDKLSSSKKPDFMIIGSSLPMCAFFYTEGPGYFDLKEGDRIRALKLNLLQSYPKAGYFHSRLKELSSKDFEVFNFAGAACMVSDSKLVIERCLAANKKPSVLIYGVGLRDFVDNINPLPGETPYYKALCNSSYLLAHLSQLMQFHSFNELSVSALCKLYDLRNEFRISAEHIACQTFHHPSSIELAFILGDLNKKYAAQHNAPAPGTHTYTTTATTAVDSAQEQTRQNSSMDVSAKSTALKPSSSKDVAPLAVPSAKQQTKATGTVLSALDYPQRYSPANYERLDSEMNELDDVLDLCQKEQIKLVLINMPVSSGHRTLSPPGLRDEYLRKLRKLAPKAALFIDCEDSNLPDANFFDTVHLNSTGAVQFADMLSSKLKESGLLN